MCENVCEAMKELFMSVNTMCGTSDGRPHVSDTFVVRVSCVFPQKNERIIRTNAHESHKNVLKLCYERDERDQRDDALYCTVV